MTRSLSSLYYSILILSFCLLVCATETQLLGTKLSSQRIPWVSPWTYTCVEDTIDGPACQRSLFNETETTDRIPLTVCLLTCGDYGALWPYPTTKVEIGDTLTSFSLDRIVLSSAEAPTELIKLRLSNSTDLALKQIANLLSSEEDGGRQSPFEKPVLAPSPNDNAVEIHLLVETDVDKITFDVDESYILTINSTEAGTKVNAFISAATYFGARHGLQTLVQLIAFNENKELFEIVNTVSIEDRPTFRYRGLLIDTARNFIPIKNLKKMVDGLSYNKMNAFHWHLTDSNSFPFYSARVPQMTKFGIFSPSKVYTPEAIIDFIEYSNDRGVKVIPELDAPSHAGNGWQWGPSENLGELTLCFDAPIQVYKDFCIQPPCGQLDPLNNNTYMVLGEVFRDFLDVFDRDYFHMGGDEISERCWLSYPHIQDWLNTESPDIMELWGIYQQQALTKLKEANNNEPISAIVWTSEMTNTARRFLNPDDYIIQIWSTSNDSVIKDILEEGYRVIFSHNDTVYLDHGYGPWRGTINKASLKIWQNLYGDDILEMMKNQIGEEKVSKMLKAGQILGGEATLWSEKTDAQNMEMKAWPRAAAYAERLWSSPAATQTKFAYPRLINHRERMVRQGIQVDTLVPESCYHIWGFCDDPEQ